MTQSSGLELLGVGDEGEDMAQARMEPGHQSHCSYLPHLQSKERPIERTTGQLLSETKGNYTCPLGMVEGQEPEENRGMN